MLYSHDALKRPTSMVCCPPACQGQLCCGSSSIMQLDRVVCWAQAAPEANSKERHTTCGARLTGIDDSNQSITLLPMWRALLRVACDERRHCQRRTPCSTTLTVGPTSSMPPTTP